jgi:hypothetical protein
LPALALPYVYSALTTIELTANPGYDPNANKSGCEIFWEGLKRSLANLSDAQKCGIVIGMLLVLVACLVVTIIAPEAAAAVAAMGKVVLEFVIGVVSAAAITAVAAVSTGGDVAEEVVNATADAILICGIFAFVSAGISAIKTGVRSVRNAKLIGSSQTGAQPQSTVNQNAKDIWPSNDGFAGRPVKIKLTKGTVIDRYGAPSGKFAAPAGTPFEMRSLPQEYLVTKTLHVYQVAKPITVMSGISAPWFGQMGGGVQYMFKKSIEKLLKSGVLIEIL